MGYEIDILRKDRSSFLILSLDLTPLYQRMLACKGVNSLWLCQALHPECFEHSVFLKLRFRRTGKILLKLELNPR